MRRLVSTAAMAVLAAASVLPVAGAVTPAAAAAHHSTRHSAPQSTRRSATVAGHLTGRQWLAQQRRALHADGATVLDGSAAAARGTYDLEQLASLVPAGKLKGSTPDVLDLRRTALPGVASPDGVTARVGATGAALWHRSLEQPAGGFVAVYPTAVGPAAHRGILVVTDSQTTAPSGPTDFSEVLAAYAGASGHLLWSQTFTGEQATNGDMSTVPSYVGEQSQAHGGPTFLVADESSTGSADSSQLVQVDGSSGSFTQLGNPATATNTIPTFLALTDVNHDGVGDVAVAVSTLSAPSIAALSGASGQLLWTVKGAFPVSIASIGHYSSTRHIDLAISLFTKSQKDEIVIVDAANGKPVWVRDAELVNVIHKAGRHLRPAVQLAKLSSVATSKKVTATIESMAVTPANKVVYDKRLSVSEAALPGQQETETPVSDAAVGDVQGDGALDELISLTAESTSTTKDKKTTKTGIIDGRTGTFRELNAGLAADGSMHKGSRTDFLLAAVRGGGVKLSAWHGATRKPYFLGRTVGGISQEKAVWATAGRVSGHSCSDVLLSAASPNAGVLGVVDGAGQPLWLVTHTANQATGGHVMHFKKPRHFCS